MFFQQRIGKDQKAEINFLFKIIKNYFYKEIQNLIVQGIKNKYSWRY